MTFEENLAKLESLTNDIKRKNPDFDQPACKSRKKSDRNRNSAANGSFFGR